MSMQTDVKALSLAATGDITTSRTRIKSMLVEPGATVGSIVLRDGGSGGVVVLTINTPAGGQLSNVLIPGEGVLFPNGAHATLSNALVTVFYG